MKFNIEHTSAVQTAREITLLLLDVDGVLTDGKLYFSNSGEEIKSFNSLDGHGIKMLLSAGINVGIITGRKSSIVEKRAKDLGLSIVVQGREDKLNALNEILADHPAELSAICYMGDDFPDVPVMRKVGLSVSVPNAHSDVKELAALVTDQKGGLGAVRELCDFLLKSKDLYSLPSE